MEKSSLLGGGGVFDCGFKGGGILSPQIVSHNFEGIVKLLELLFGFIIGKSRN